jgi:DNA-binding GntR family transcriptional regulator
MNEVRFAGADPWSGIRSALLLRAIRIRSVQKRSGGAMKDEVTSILSAIEQGDPRAAERILPLVYDELRRLAAQRLAQEKPGQTLQPTALVHEA